MMLGAVTYELRVETETRMEGFAGRLLHAAFFRLLSAFNPDLAERIHADTRAKPFSLSPLLRLQARTGKEKMLYSKEPFLVQKGETFLWRIATWSEEILTMAVSLPLGTNVQIGHVPCTITQIYSDGRKASGILSPEQIITTAMEDSHTREVTLHFLSPVSFRRGTQDYPLPEPKMVFTSLAKKWELANMPARIEPEVVAEIAERIAPSDWSGRTERVYFGQHHGLTGFTGFFNYTLQELSEEEKQIVKILAQLAVFTGVGRMTAQGFGQTRINWQ